MEDNLKILKVKYLSNLLLDHTQNKNLRLDDQTIFFKSSKWRQPPMEDDIKILNVEYLSNHCTFRDFWFLFQILLVPEIFLHILCYISNCHNSVVKLPFFWKIDISILRYNMSNLTNFFLWLQNYPPSLFIFVFLLLVDRMAQKRPLNGPISILGFPLKEKNLKF